MPRSVNSTKNPVTSPVTGAVKSTVKRAVNLSLNAKVLDSARELGLNVSATVDALLTEEVRRIYWERWNAENKLAIEHYNARIAREGLPLARHRSFMKSR